MAASVTASYHLLRPDALLSHATQCSKGTALSAQRLPPSTANLIHRNHARLWQDPASADTCASARRPSELGPTLRLSDAQQSARRPCGNFLGRLLNQEGVLPQSHNQQICVIFLCGLDDSVNFIPINQFGIERDASGIRFLPSGGLMQCM